VLKNNNLIPETVCHDDKVHAVYHTRNIEQHQATAGSQTKFTNWLYTLSITAKHTS